MLSILVEWLELRLMTSMRLLFCCSLKAETYQSMVGFLEQIADVDFSVGELTCRRLGLARRVVPVSGIG